MPFTILKATQSCQLANAPFMVFSFDVFSIFINVLAFFFSFSHLSHALIFLLAFLLHAYWKHVHNRGPFEML